MSDVVEQEQQAPSQTSLEALTSRVMAAAKEGFGEERHPDLPVGDGSGRTRADVAAEQAEPEPEPTLEELRAQGHEINRAVSPHLYDEDGKYVGREQDDVSILRRWRRRAHGERGAKYRAHALGRARLPEPRGAVEPVSIGHGDGRQPPLCGPARERARR